MKIGQTMLSLQVADSMVLRVRSQNSKLNLSDSEEINFLIESVIGVAENILQFVDKCICIFILSNQQIYVGVTE